MIELATSRRDNKLQKYFSTESAGITALSCMSLEKDATFDGVNQELNHADNSWLNFNGIDFSGGVWVDWDGVSSCSIIGQWSGSSNRAWSIGTLTGGNRVAMRMSYNGSALAAKNITWTPTAPGLRYIQFYHEDGVEFAISQDNASFFAKAHTTGLFNSTANFQIGAGHQGFFSTTVRAFWLSKSLLKTTSGFHNSGTAPAYCELSSTESDIIDGTTAEGVYYNLDDLTEASGSGHMGTLNNINSVTFDAF